MIVQEYICPTHDRFELIEACNEDETPRACPKCGAPSAYTISAPATHMPVGTVVTGGSDERPPHALDTRPLAEGMPAAEWHKKERKKVWEDIRNKHRKEMA